MVLPGTWSAVLYLLVFSTLCFGLWPNIFKLAGRWRFELFSFDFGLGALVGGLIAAFTLGTLGSTLNFSDSMLVAGQRAEVMAVATGMVFALANMLYLATITLLGLSNGTLLTFSIFGCALSVIELLHKRYVTGGGGLLLLLIAAALAIASASAKRLANLRPNEKPGATRASKQVSTTTKGAVTGILAGIFFAGVVPVIALAETEELGIGAYGGVLLATVGIFGATFFFNFFFLNISLEGGVVGYSTYTTGTFKDHVTGVFCGLVWTAGALALYAACTGPASATRFEAWITPFAGALIAVLSGLAFWQKVPQPGAAILNTVLSIVLFAGGVGVLLMGMQK